jgi:hypothetical protein
MGWKKQFVASDGGVQRDVKLAKYWRGNWCCMNSYSEAKGPFYRWLLFFQIQGIFYATTCNCWSYEMIFEHFCWHVEVYELCKSVALVFNLPKATIGDLFQ